MVKRKSTRIRIVLVVASSQKNRNYYTPQQSVRNSYDIQMFHENFFHLTFLWWYNTRFVRKIERHTITTVMWFRSSNDKHRIKIQFTLPRRRLRWRTIVISPFPQNHIIRRLPTILKVPTKSNQTNFETFDVSKIRVQSTHYTKLKNVF